MSVYTKLLQPDIEHLLARYALGTYRAHRGISAGVENTNYFVDTSSHQLVLTLFEKHSHAELPFYLNLGEHLFRQHCKVPQPFRCQQGDLLQTIKGKPAVLIERLPGAHVSPSVAYALDIARALGQVHVATASFEQTQAHSHDLAWVQRTAGILVDQMTPADGQLLRQSLSLLQQVPDNLPQGIIHADLFHDNALFDAGHISGIIDWYFAGRDAYALDIAIALNDWCVDGQGRLDRACARDFVAAYQSQRPLGAVELDCLTLLQIQAATRFWLSRVLAQAQYSPSDGNITVKDPQSMKALLVQLIGYT
ncbi:homoserine kinase [Reinekea sp.]|jgi:homoserine kinase type II|uniref:homoserine kinase n=1 Tax=Reinekea sp. TaxID=1970455 RepID=UPI002A821AD1|nr:homoserine kinase [Reinekea sp.]